MKPETVIYRARKIVTMDRSNPTATHVAVREGRILAVGDDATVSAWGAARRDDRYKDVVLLPGFVEGHSHAWTGIVWAKPYVGYHDRVDPDGKIWKGCASIEAVVERLREAASAMTDADAVLSAWGFDPIYFGMRRVGAADLDRVSGTRPVVVRHSNGHVMSINSAMMKRAGLHRGINAQGLMRDDNGEPTGELKGIPLQFMVMKAAGTSYEDELSDPATLPIFARAAKRVGVTTVTDLGNAMPPNLLDAYARITSDPAFCLRVSVAFRGQLQSIDEGIARLKTLVTQGNDKLHFGIVKFVADGSIQGLSARLKWPGYISGVPNGLWYMAPEQIDDYVHAYHAAGFQVHVHTNGDEASEVVIEAVEKALARTPRWDHRHTLQHCQMADEAQFRRMKALGMCANIFANHIFYWGDEHARFTMGPDKARRIDAVGSAIRCGVPVTIHSDTPVTPLDPLFTAWCAVNRLTNSGKVLGPEERISVADALRLITLGAAYTLKLDHVVGSIEIGKFADFAVLADDPLAVEPEKLKEVEVLGTVFGGNPNPV
jgi:hypothetical protein